MSLIIDEETFDVYEDPDSINSLTGFKCIDCGSYLQFVGDYLVTCPNHECKMYGIEFDAN